MNKYKKAFTLIELLVVMTIISVLLGISMVAFQGSRKSARDTKRTSDLEQIRSALEVYRSDQGGYPPSSYSISTGLICSPNTYMSGVNDLLSPSRVYAYVPGTNPANVCSGVGNGATTYSLCAALENPPAVSAIVHCIGGSRCGSGIVCNYEIDNP
jgi:general secretion pathway protein G